MVDSAFNEVYTKFKLNFYRGIFERIKEREGSLSASEAYAVEVIHALDKPTISQFAQFLQVSKSNATYKVNTLIKKGYIEKIQSDTDRREAHLHTTPKFMQYYAINQNYINVVTQRIKEHFSVEELKRFDEMLRIISSELMPEANEKLQLDKAGREQNQREEE
ncbi:MAG: MarR family transcriptional regulator [Coriobacteriia bacterium]|nr:MarR family transcriptional regulator [Coriobacteriia bacterium]MCL2746404.1 MarR family transcriptional regulator [Coriobacteriia bacterium]MCL2871001.1 MarR family transcriptional regulator [Coriobacteriia bacterium]